MPVRGNPSKLIPTNRRSKQEASDLGRKGGIRSGIVRKEKKLLSQIYAELLADEYEANINGKTAKITGAKLVQTIARDIIMRRDSSSVSMMKEIREATEGQKINMTGELTVSALTPEERRQRIDELERKRKGDT
jgi:hypothetical protein